MSVYNQFAQQRSIQIQNTFDAKMHRIDQMKAKAPSAENNPEGEARERANRHKLRVAAAEEFCDARRTLKQVYGPYTKEK